MDSQTIQDPQILPNISTPFDPHKIMAAEPFRASSDEKAAAFLTFIPAYFYAKMLCEFLLLPQNSDWRTDFSIFLLGAVGITIFLFRKEKLRWESLLWLVCVLLSGTGIIFGVGAVWEDYQKLLLAHGFLAYWVLSFSNRLSRAETSCLFPWDIAHGLLFIPLKCYFYRIKTMSAAFRDRNTGHKSMAKEKKGTGKWALFAVLTAGILLLFSILLLISADEAFSSLIRDSLELFDADKIGRNIGYFFLSLPAAAYLYGIVGGLFRLSAETVRERGDAVFKRLKRVRKVVPFVWAVLIMVFALVYVVFFVLQWPWVIDAFKGICPPDPRTYARESFFALIKVSLINFIMLGLTHNTADDSEKGRRFLSVSKITLLFCNVIFCIISGSKLLLYISVHGFTPLRLQAAWLVVTLFLACIASGVSILIRKKTMIYWMAVSGLLAALLCVVL